MNPLIWAPPQAETGSQKQYWMPASPARWAAVTAVVVVAKTGDIIGDL